MIFNRDILFIHVPKTGGMSASRYLLNVLPRPVYYSLPTPDETIKDPGIIQIPGIRHECLSEAAEVTARYGFELSSFKAIIAVIRNPYAMDVSRYAYLQKGHAWDKGHNQQLALDEDFETFAMHSFDHAGHSRPIQSFLVVDGKMPPNLRVLRCENLAEELAGALREAGIKPSGELPRDNESKHGDFMSYYTKNAEEAVARRYAWIFEHGFYDRVDPSTFKYAEGMPRSGPDIPLCGPVRQTGTSGGLWHDSWVGENLRFEVRAIEPVNRLIIEGSVPDRQGGIFTATIRLKGVDYKREVCERQNFRWEICFRANPGESMRISVIPGELFRPIDLGINADTRRLSFMLKGVSFSMVQGMPWNSEGEPV